MTCIIGYENNGTVWMGADSAGVSGYVVQVRKDKKVFRRGDFLFGFSGSFRLGQILRYHFNPTPWNKEIYSNLSDFIVVSFIEEVKNVLKEFGVKKNEEECCPFLVGAYGSLFGIDCDYQLVESTLCFNSIGQGFEFAMGSLYTTQKMNMSIEEKINIALSTSANFCSGVVAPFYIEKI